MNVSQRTIDHVENVDTSPTAGETSTYVPQSCSQQILRLYQNHRFLICSIITTCAVIVTTCFVIAYFLNTPAEPTNKPIACEEIPSRPSHVTCGYASACTRCEAIFPEKDICEAYYDADCGNLRCFCKPECGARDCTPANIFFNK